MPTHGTAAVYDADAGEWVELQSVAIRRWVREVYDLEQAAASDHDKLTGGSYAGSPCHLDGKTGALAGVCGILQGAWLRYKNGLDAKV